MVKECIFCNLSEGKVVENVIYENDNFFSVFDLYPEVEGHSLVISKKHFNTVLDLPINLGGDLLDCINKTANIVIEKYGAKGFNVANNNFRCANQVVDHLHFHILPRKEGDNFSITKNFLKL